MCRTSDDGEDTVATYKAALAKERELQATTQQAKQMEEQVRKLEQLLQPKTNEDSIREGGRDSLVRRRCWKRSQPYHQRSKLHLWQYCSAGSENVKEENLNLCQSTQECIIGKKSVLQRTTKIED